MVILVSLDREAGADGMARVHLFSVATKTAGPTFARPLTSPYRSDVWWNVSLDEAGDRLAFATYEHYKSDGVHAVVDVSSGALLAKWDVPLSSHEMTPVYLSPDGQHVARSLPSSGFEIASVLGGASVTALYTPLGWLGDRVLGFE